MRVSGRTVESTVAVWIDCVLLMLKEHWTEVTIRNILLIKACKGWRAISSYLYPV